MIVVDADVIAYFWLEAGAKRTTAARRARRKDGDWIAPHLWRSEFRSVLRGYLNAGLLTLGTALKVAEKAEKDMRGHEYDVVTTDVLRLVQRSRHSAYDCEYVALAQSLRVPLVTGDQELPALFPDSAVLLEDFIAR
ncbi:MAG: type II toxin-antitoxin system VapC family toxin [Rhodothermales bacterium]